MYLLPSVSNSWAQKWLTSIGLFFWKIDNFYFFCFYELLTTRVQIIYKESACHAIYNQKLRNVNLKWDMAYTRLQPLAQSHFLMFCLYLFGSLKNNKCLADMFSITSLYHNDTAMVY